MAQSAGSLITTLGATWLDFGPSSATALQSTSAAGTFTSPGTGGQIHNTFSAELAFTYFVTDNIALDLATGVLPKSQALRARDGCTVWPRRADARLRT